MKKRTSFILVLCILLSFFQQACASAETTEPSVTAEPADQITMTLDEYLEQRGEEWFLTGKRQYAVQAMMSNVGGLVETKRIGNEMTYVHKGGGGYGAETP